MGNWFGQADGFLYLSCNNNINTCNMQELLKAFVRETEDLCFGLFLRISPQISISTSVARED